MMGTRNWIPIQNHVFKSPTSTVTHAKSTATSRIISFSVGPTPLYHFAKIKWDSNIQATDIFIDIYSPSFRLLRAYHLEKKDTPDWLTPGKHFLPWDVTDENERPLEPGEYFFDITIDSSKGTFTSSILARVK